MLVIGVTFAGMYIYIRFTRFAGYRAGAPAPVPSPVPPPPAPDFVEHLGGGEL